MVNCAHVVIFNLLVYRPVCHTCIIAAILKMATTVNAPIKSLEDRQDVIDNVDIIRTTSYHNMFSP